MTWEVKGLEVFKTSSNKNKIIMPIKLTNNRKEDKLKHFQNFHITEGFLLPGHRFLELWKWLSCQYLLKRKESEHCTAIKDLC